MAKKRTDRFIENEPEKFVDFKMAPVPPGMIGGSKLIKLLTYLPDDVRALAAGAIADESEWIVCMGAPAKTPLELLGQYNLLEDNGYGVFVPPNVPESAGATFLKIFLRKTHGWGEFLGGVLASVPNFSPVDRGMIMDELIAAIRYAAVHGVDH